MCCWIFPSHMYFAILMLWHSHWHHCQSPRREWLAVTASSKILKRFPGRDEPPILPSACVRIPLFAVIWKGFRFSWCTGWSSWVSFHMMKPKSCQVVNLPPHDNCLPKLGSDGKEEDIAYLFSEQWFKARRYQYLASNEGTTGNP